jgi:hypothetical protein
MDALLDAFAVVFCIVAVGVIAHSLRRRLAETAPRRLEDKARRREHVHLLVIAAGVAYFILRAAVSCLLGL